MVKEYGVGKSKRRQSEMSVLKPQSPSFFPTPQYHQYQTDLSAVSEPLLQRLALLAGLTLPTRVKACLEQ